jgi:hypothetical protein
MSILFSKLLTDCLAALGDNLAATWSRTTTIWPWCIEAMLSFPILRPQQQAFTAEAAVREISLNTDFREIIGVEYPVDQDPPSYLIRKNRFDPVFFTDDRHYDIDRDYESGKGWVLWLSKTLAIDDQVNINYLATHDLDMLDDTVTVITVPDEYENILIAYVIARAYRERLSLYLQDPTAHTSLIMQMTDMVEKAENNYQHLVLRAQEKLTDSRTSPRMQADKFDRVY